MSDRALFVLPDGIVVEEPWHISNSHIQYQQGLNAFAVERIRSGSDIVQGTTWEIYKEAYISEDEAIARVRAWNQSFPDLAVPPIRK